MRRRRVRGFCTHLGLQSQDTMRERPREKERDPDRDTEREQSTGPKAEAERQEKEKVIEMLVVGNLV